MRCALVAGFAATETGEKVSCWNVQTPAEPERAVAGARIVRETQLRVELGTARRSDDGHNHRAGARYPSSLLILHSPSLFANLRAYRALKVAVMSIEKFMQRSDLMGGCQANPGIPNPPLRG
jgi:hypothetical protein